MIKPMIKILDCTLRDGGYLVDWNFGQGSICSISENLSKSGIDFIELGFLKECNFNKDKTFFSSVSDLESLISETQKYTLMVNFGEYDIEKFFSCENKNIKIRVAFKKHNQKEALDYILKLKNLGWDVFVNPMSTNTYTKNELEDLIYEINSIKPYGLSIVDTLGNMYEQDVVNIFEFIDKNLDSEISLGFHSHNSLQLSFSNTKTLLKMGIKREIIIDSCLYGMGRGAGNLCTELIAKYLNDNNSGNYNISPLLKSIDIDLKPIYQKSAWGYSTPYYIAALHGCHPNYAGYLVKKGFSDEKIDEILSQISFENKTIYNIDYINTLIKSSCCIA
jgi:4-hydroxy 2-oxovalerate aldolase